MVCTKICRSVLCIGKTSQKCVCKHLYSIAEICSSWILSCLPTEMFVVFLKLWAAFFFAHIAMICPILRPTLPPPLSQSYRYSLTISLLNTRKYSQRQMARVFWILYIVDIVQEYSSLYKCCCVLRALPLYTITHSLCLLCILLCLQYSIRGVTGLLCKLTHHRQKCRLERLHISQLLHYIVLYCQCCKKRKSSKFSRIFCILTKFRELQHILLCNMSCWNVCIIL